jgi:hypothetical protein
MTTTATCWQLRDRVAELHCGSLHARPNLERLSRGLEDIRWNGSLCRHAPFQLLVGDDAPATRHVETYVRGNDLITTYASDGPTGAPQIYWRATHHADLASTGLEIVVSKHTPLLDSQPLSTVQSLCQGRLFHADQLDVAAFQSIESQELIPIGGSSSSTHLFLVRNEDEPCTFAQLVHPTDFERVELRDQRHGATRSDLPGWHLMSYLFSERLEKGVIRRARICGWFMPAENDLEVAVELARRFVNEPPPLTT